MRTNSPFSEQTSLVLAEAQACCVIDEKKKKLIGSLRSSELQ